MVLRLSCSILNTSEYLITVNDIPITNNTNTTSNITILDTIASEKVILSFIAFDIYELPIVASFDLYFGSVSMPVHILFPNGSVAAGVSVHANITDAPSVSQSGYTNENGTIIFTNVPRRTISLFARTTNNQIALTGIAPSLLGITLVLIPFGSNSSTNTTMVSGQQAQSLNTKSSRDNFFRRITKRDVELPGFSVNTSGQQLQMISRTFMTEKNSTSAYVRYKFITEEVPGGYFGSIFNDYFTVTIRSQGGSYESLSQSMNGLGLGAFDNASGETNWYTLKLKVSAEPELIQVDVGVSNVGDAAYQSAVIVDKIGIEKCDKCNDCDICQSDPMCRDTCLNPPFRSCLFYEDCMESKISCGANGYAIGYGKKYCTKYSNRLSSFTSQGQDWIHETMNCLQKALVTPLQNCDSTCETLRQIAFASHPSCYINAGVCDLSANDWYQIFTTVAKDLFNEDGFIQAIKTTKDCLPTIINRIENQLASTIDFTRIKFRIMLSWFMSI